MVMLIMVIVTYRANKKSTTNSKDINCSTQRTMHNNKHYQIFNNQYYLICNHQCQYLIFQEP
jgi:hypothetical protein